MQVLSASFASAAARLPQAFLAASPGRLAHFPRASHSSLRAPVRQARSAAREVRRQRSEAARDRAIDGPASSNAQSSAAMLATARIGFLLPAVDEIGAPRAVRATPGAGPARR